MKLAQIPLICVLMMGACDFPGEKTKLQSQSEQDASSFEKDGLRASIKDIRWSKGDVSFLYILKHEKAQNSWFLDEECTLNITVWDAQGQLIRNDIVAFALLDNDFVLEKKRYIETPVSATIPGNSRFIAVQLGRSELKTKKVQLP